VLEISILINKQINQMTTEIMTFNELIAEIVKNKLIRYVEDCRMYKIKLYQEMEMDKYYTGEGDYDIHLHYLIETWKNYIDEAGEEGDFKIDYEYKGTYDELWNYYVNALCPSFDYNWLHDIFERKILVTNVCLK
jgi:hypothetical protein